MIDKVTSTGGQGDYLEPRGLLPINPPLKPLSPLLPPPRALCIRVHEPNPHVLSGVPNYVGVLHHTGDDHAVALLVGAPVEVPVQRLDVRVPVVRAHVAGRYLLLRQRGRDQQLRQACVLVPGAQRSHRQLRARADLQLERHARPETRVSHGIGGSGGRGGLHDPPELVPPAPHVLPILPAGRVNLHQFGVLVLSLHMLLLVLEVRIRGVCRYHALAQLAVRQGMLLGVGACHEGGADSVDGAGVRGADRHILLRPVRCEVGLHCECGQCLLLCPCPCPVKSAGWSGGCWSCRGLLELLGELNAPVEECVHDVGHELVPVPHGVCAGVRLAVPVRCVRGAGEVPPYGSALRYHRHAVCFGQRPLQRV
mmetsp:Transcript_4621/g.10204  ORF Transcript_4621/g.10204 Transcript_4621/m.10204 type:complete len:367 (+) Transcript_4621:27-1127(+)